MAITKLWSVKNRVDHVIDYAKDEVKTKNESYGKEHIYDLLSVYGYAINSDKTEKQYYVSGINCNVENAVKEMNEIKKKYNKNGGILAFHGVQSFEKDEVRPEKAHEIGKKLAEELWGDRFQVIVTTHLNTEHLHNHFVINSVSFKDGYKYYSNYENTAIMRKISDDICREYGLSVLEDSKCKKVNFDYFYNKNITQDDYYKFIKEDIDFAIKRAFSFEEFMKILKQIGYEFYFRANQMSIRMPLRKMYLRVERNFGQDYSVQRMKERIFESFIDKKSISKQEYKVTKGKYYCKNKKIKNVKKGGIISLYRHYCYLLKVYPKRNWQYKLSYETRKAITKLDNYTSQLRFVVSNNIKSVNDIDVIRNSKKEKLQEAYNYRNRLYYSRKKLNNKEEITEKIIEATEYITKIKKDLKMCNDVEKEIVKIKEELKEFYKKEDKRKDKKLNMKKLNKRMLCFNNYG